MRIDGDTPLPATRGNARRGQPGPAQFREPFRFSNEGHIFDLTVEAMRQTVRGGIGVAWQVPASPYEPPYRRMNCGIITAGS